MDDHKEDLAEYFGRTVVHPAGLTLCILLAIAMFLVPRRWAFVPMLILGCFVSAAQRIMIGGLNFDFPRLLIVAGWLRLIVRGELGRLVWNRIDACVIAFAVFGLAAYCALHNDADAVKYRLGWAFDVLGFYFLFRNLFAAGVDPRDIAKAFVVISVPVAMFFAVEYATHRNLFAIFGGVPAVTWVRDGRLRCQGPFAHPIIAGVFWAGQLPVLGAMWWSGGSMRRWATVGIAMALFIVFATNSSTSVMAVVFGAAAMLAFPLRGSMRTLRWIALAVLVALHIVMKAPVWHLLARATVFDASTGWHRYFVIDQAVRHFGEWWPMGTLSTASWDVTDITNEYVVIGIEGGAATLAAFVAVLVCCFSRVGAQVARLARNPAAQLVAWALGAALFAHMMNFIGLSYFGQARIIWYLLLATIASAGAVHAGAAGRSSAVPAARPVRALRAVPLRQRSAHGAGRPPRG